MWGIQPSDFWRMSPREWWLVCDAKSPGTKTDIEDRDEMVRILREGF